MSPLVLFSHTCIHGIISLLLPAHFSLLLLVIIPLMLLNLPRLFFNSLPCSCFFYTPSVSTPAPAYSCSSSYWCYCSSSTLCCRCFYFCLSSAPTPPPAHVSPAVPPPCLHGFPSSATLFLLLIVLLPLSLLSLHLGFKL